MTMYLSDFSRDVRSGPVIVESKPNGTSRSNRVYRNVVKRTLDVVLVLLSAPFTVPLILFLALIVALDGHNPFYTQKRVGKSGKPFRLWKLRTMVSDADAALEAYLRRHPEARLEWNATQKLKNDPRITRTGRVLRKLSLDELPQLLNVLNGTMSLVGPRPMMLNQQHLYSGHCYYRLRPGITGLWQVSHRNECEFAGRVFYDDLYDRVVSLRTDLGVLMRTVAVVMRGTGY